MIATPPKSPTNCPWGVLASELLFFKWCSMSIFMSRWMLSVFVGVGAGEPLTAFFWPGHVCVRLFGRVGGTCMPSCASEWCTLATTTTAIYTNDILWASLSQSWYFHTWVAQFLPVFMLHCMSHNLHRTLGTVLLLHCTATPFHSLEAEYNKW